MIRDRSSKTIALWQKDIDNTEELAVKKRIAIGCTVKTEHGSGTVMKRDHPYRFVVEISNATNKHKEMVCRFKDSKLCYFPHEIEVI